MPVTSVWILEESNITISGGAVLDGVSQGDGSHLVGRSITLNAADWVETQISDDDANFADNDGNQTLSGAQVIDGVTYVNGTRVEAEYTLILTDPSTGLTYRVIGYNVLNSSPNFGTIEALAFIGPESAWPPVGTALTVTSASEGPPQSGSGVTSYASYVTPACFTPGTRIKTPDGPVLVEWLKPGDIIQTRNGPMPLVYVARSFVGAARLLREPDLRPLRIARSAFAPGLPDRSITVSPQHRFLVQGAACALHFAEDEVLVAAKDLRAARPVPLAELQEGVTYLHLAFATPQIVVSEGVESESFLIGPEVFETAPEAAKQEMRRLFPELTLPDGPVWQSSCHRHLRAWEARLLPA